MGCSGGWLLAPQGWLCHQRHMGLCLRCPVPPSRSHTSHPCLCKRPPCHTVTQVLPSFPDMTSKELRGSLEVLACWLPVPCGQCPRLLSSSRPRPRAGLPHSLAPGPPAIIPALLQRTSCLWVHPHQPGRHVLSLLSPSNRTRGTSRFLLQGSLQRPLRVSESSLGVASTVPLPARSPLLCQQAVSPALQGNSPGARGTHATKPPPFLALPHATPPPPACLSLGSRPCPPCGYSSVPCAPSQPWNAGCPTALPLHPISLHRHLPGDFTMLMPLNAICIPMTPSPP